MSRSSGSVWGGSSGRSVEGLVDDARRLREAAGLPVGAVPCSCVCVWLPHGVLKCYQRAPFASMVCARSSFPSLLSPHVLTPSGGWGPHWAPRCRGWGWGWGRDWPGLHLYQWRQQSGGSSALGPAPTAIQQQLSWGWVLVPVLLRPRFGHLKAGPTGRWHGDRVLATDP
jgi:hypothetical protein